MNKKVSAFLAGILCVALLAGCGGGDSKPSGESASDPVAPSTKLDKPPQPKQILSDVNHFGVEELEQDMATGTSCEIVKRQSNPEDKEDITYIRLLCENEFSRREYQFKLMYTFYDVGGWLLEDVIPEKPEEWTEVFYDYQGNDLMDSIVWMDAYDIEDFIWKERPLGEYYDEVDGVHYIRLHHSDAVYDHMGNRVTDSVDGGVRDIFVSKEGEVRITLDERVDDEYLEYLADASGNRMSDSYYQIYGPYGEDKILIVETEEIIGDYEDFIYTYGAIDMDGNLVAEVKYENYGAVLETLGIPVPQPVEEDEPVIVWYEPYYDDDKDCYLNRYFREDGTPIEVPEGDRNFCDYRQGLLFVQVDGVARYYDIDGNVRSPGFVPLEGDGSGHERTCNLIAYEGRCGILPNYAILGRDAARTVEFERIETNGPEPKKTKKAPRSD